jgi:hypothetical protein
VTDEELLSLPPRLALRVLLDCLDPETIAALRACALPPIPRSPKYDTSLYTSGGVKWASECDLENLAYFRDRSLSSAQSGGEYSDRDRKLAATLEKWMEWRGAFPDLIWTGERNSKATVAAPPSGKPQVHARTGPGARKRPSQEEAPLDDDYYGTGSKGDEAPTGSDDDIPF